MSPHKVAIIGSGNWGTAIAKIIGRNVEKYSDFENNVNMWMHEEQVDGKDLTAIFNEKHENVKYLPGVRIPENVVAQSDLHESVKDATLLVFVLPDNFIRSVCDDLQGYIHKDAIGISLTKGIEVGADGVQIYPDLIKKILGVDTCSLSGANIANEVALEKFGETTVGFREIAHAETWRKLIQTDDLRVGIVQDVAGVALAGALKNIVALAAGFSDGLDYGDNTKAAIMRIGLAEMKKFSEHFFEGIRQETWIESCGMADIITSCYGGRNRRCAEAFVKTKKPFAQLEKELLNGQKLQGTITTAQVHKLLAAKGIVDDFPLFYTTYRIAFEGMPAEELTHGVIGRKSSRL
ncbi:hypothetical protein HWV62_20964 [Athelia sp. TMB]|nr:hypothetical protein HWV62_20964 [Athelia sp. TMB]